MLSQSQLWWIAQPERQYYDHLYIDGTVSHQYRLPGLKCSICTCWGGGSRILPFESPSIYRPEIARLSELGWLPIERFDEYRTRWEHELQKEGHEIKLKPGDSFQPGEWRVPSSPRFNLFWPNLTMVASDRLAKAFEQEGISGISFHPMVLTKVGKRQPVLPIPDSVVEDPHNLFGNLPYYENPAECGTFHEIILNNHTRDVLFAEEQRAGRVCERCGDMKNVMSEKQLEEENALRESKVIPRKYTYEVDVFGSHIFHGLILNDRAYQLLGRLGAENYEATPIAIIK